MTACCIVYLSDQTYLFPTMISAIQARRFSSVEKADVLICHLGVTPAIEREFAAICANEGIELLRIDPALIDGANAMMARLFLNRFIPAKYTQYLYVDGDVQITGTLDPLIDAEVPPGHFLAANDPMTFMLADDTSQSRAFMRHMREIGLDPDQAGAYFNTGVLRINRSGWADLGARAWELVGRQRRDFRFPDQDPLNMVAAMARIPMSLAWNFPIFMRNAGVEAAIRPSVYHFMSNPKPWQGVFPPWRADANEPYREIVRRYPALAAHSPRMSAGRRLRYHVQQRYKKIGEVVTWGLSHRRRRILRYEAGIALAGPG